MRYDNIEDALKQHDSIYQELKEHASEVLSYNEHAIDDLHHLAFNEDYYIIGYYQARQWFEKHKLDGADAVWLVEHEANAQGLPIDKLDNYETLVNLFVYFAGLYVVTDMHYEEKHTTV